MNQFYLLEGYGERSFCYAYKDTSVRGIQSAVCHSCGRMVSSWSFDGPHHLLLEGKHTFPDRLMFCGAGEPMLIVSATAANVLEENSITGIGNREPIAATYIEQETPPYFLVQICGSISLDFKRMGLKKKNVCNHCGSFRWNRQRLYPLVPNVDTWDGSDLCRVSDIPGYIICTERFVKAVTDTGLTGFCFKAL